MQALIHETEKMCAILKDDYLRDAGLIASRKSSTSEIAAYGSAAALAGQLDLREDQRLLHRALEEERRADELLTTLAKGEINQDAGGLSLCALRCCAARCRCSGQIRNTQVSGRHYAG